MLQKYKNIGGIATKRLIWYMETILSSSYSLFYASLSSVCSCCFSWLCNDIVHCWRHNAARLAFAFLIWSSMCMCIQCKSFHVSNFSAFRIFAKHSNQRVLYIHFLWQRVLVHYFDCAKRSLLMMMLMLVLLPFSVASFSIEMLHVVLQWRASRQ